MIVPILSINMNNRGDFPIIRLCTTMIFSTEFLITSLIVVLIPGTGVIYTVSTGLFLGGRASMAAAMGCTAGIIPHLTATILGLSAILHMGAVAFQVLKYAGTLYLLYLAWSMWRDTGGLDLTKPAGKRGHFHIALKGILINILNPKLSIFFLAYLPLFISPQAPSVVQQLLVLSAVFMGMTLVIFILYGLLASRVRAYFLNSAKTRMLLQRSFATLFAVLAARMALGEQ